MKRFLAFLCVLAMVLSIVPGAAFAATQDVQAIIDAGAEEIIVLEADASNVTVNRDITIDLNGHNLDGVTVFAGTLYCMDSQTADYTVADGVYGHVTNVTGTVKAAEGYLQVGDSFHAVNLDIYAMTLRASDVGVYYKSHFAADEVVAEQVESFGVALSVVTAPNAENLDSYCGYSQFTGFEAGEGANSVGTSTLLKGIMKAANGDNKNAKNAAMPVYGRAYIKTAEGYYFGETVKRSLQQQVEAIDGVWENLSETQQASVVELWDSYAPIMEGWNIPNILGGEAGEGAGEITVPVEVTAENGVVTEAVTVEQGAISITVPTGTKLAEGAEKLTLTVTPVEAEDTGLTLKEDRVLIPMDVHVEGVAADNAQPITIYLGKIMPENLNMGNYTVYHVENGNANEMTLIGINEEFTAHNQYKYSLDGELTLYMASFSVVAAEVDEEATWEGGRDYSWYDADAETLYIRNADQLAGFGAIVGGMDDQTADSFAGQTVVLLANIKIGDLNSENGIVFYPIGYYNTDGTYEKTNTDIDSWFKPFAGTFDGNGNTISNFYQNTWEMKGDHNWYDAELQYYRDGMGLFGKVYGGTVKNLTVDNFSCDSEIGTTGTIAAYADCGATFENITIFQCNPRVYNIGNGGIVGCVGWYANEVAEDPVTFKNITVDNSNKISALWGTYDACCGGILGQYYPTSGQDDTIQNKGIHFENCYIAAEMDVNNDVCGNYQYYWYRYCGMLLGSVCTNAKDPETGYTVADTKGITATDCEVNYGDWNEYWYCELVENSRASYTHDHKFSRLTPIASIDEIKTDDTWTKTGNFILDADTCYHIREDADGNFYEHTHDMGGTESFDVNGDALVDENDLKEDRVRYYIPFNQLLTGYGWGVKAHLTLDGVTVNETGGTLESQEKFQQVESFDTNIIAGSVFDITDIFEAKENANISTGTIHVYVSPVGDDSTVEPATCIVDNGYTEGHSIAFNGTGAAKITITDYWYCKPTTIIVAVNEQQASEKFTANAVAEQNAYTQITLDTLFDVKDSATIGNVTATVTDPNGKVTTVTGTSSDWATKTIDLTKDGTWTVVIQDDDEYCSLTTANFTVNPVDKFTKKFDKDFLYRVGNENAFNIGYIFGEKDTAVALSSVSVTIDNVAGNAAGNYTSNETWTSGDLEFTGTGVVKVTISADGANAVSIYLEVVEAYNKTLYSQLQDGQNSVFLCDVTMTSGGTYRLTGEHVLYGNGFKFDVTNGAYAAPGYDYASYVIYLENSRLDNVEIEGAVYPEVGGTRDDDYNRAIVMTSGECSIVNSYISNGASPIRNGGNLELINTTLKGGAYANLDLRNGHLILDNVTTVNQIGANDKYNGTTEIVGMGVVIYQEGGSEALKITIRNKLAQFNYLSETQAEQYFTGTYSSAISGKVFSDDFADYQNGEWVNFGIVSMNNYFTEADLIDERTDKQGYFGKATTVSVGESRNCYVYSFKPASASAVEYPGYISAGQGIIEPAVDFDFEEKNYVQKEEGNNRYCYNDGDKVLISMDEGDSFEWDTSILTAEKYGEELAYTVKFNGSDYTGKTITFDTTGTYEVVYSFSDDKNYKIENSVLRSFAEDYEETVVIEVSVVKALAKHAVFSFGANGNAYSGRTEQIGTDTYVMPDVTAIVSGEIGSTTVSGQTVYYPITEMYTSDGKTKHTGSWYACFPIFKDALQIIDYADQGTGDPVTYNQESVTTVAQIPSTLKATNPTSAFLYSMNATNYPPPTDPTEVDGAVCYTCNRNGLSSSNTREEMTIIAQYTYTDNAGTPYYYYIGYHCEAQESGSSLPCVTPDTLVTLADGTQKEIQSIRVGDEVLAWNFYTGKYEIAPVSLLQAHSTGVQNVLHLYFEDGTELKLLGEHGVFNADLNTFVFIDEYDVGDYIGHSFVKQADDGFETVKLVGYEVTTEYTTAYTILSYAHYNVMAEGMFTVTPAHVGDNFFNPFDVGEDMKYDEADVQADIEKYGLYTYEDFDHVLTYEQFVALNIAHFKVSVGKGYITYDGLIYLIENFVNNEDFNVKG